MARPLYSTHHGGRHPLCVDAGTADYGQRAGIRAAALTHRGASNLPSPVQQALAALFGPIPALLQEVAGDASDDFALTIAQSRQSGYANSF
jgi:hypothetical protein